MARLFGKRCGIQANNSAAEIYGLIYVIFVDLPDPMVLGDATIDVIDMNSPAMETASSIVTIVPDETGTGTGGTLHSFEAKLGPFSFNMADQYFQALERVPHY